MNTPDEGVPDELPGVAPRLRDLRRDRGLTLEAAAGRAGLSPAHLSRLESGRWPAARPLRGGGARI
ncbi:helix-turn-helix domain-containing protein, partial [Streptomyces anulatus]